MKVCLDLYWLDFNESGWRRMSLDRIDGLLTATCPECGPTPISCHWLIRIFSAVNLNHFRLLRVVGKGAFGKVRIVERKDTGLTFALKYIRKDESRSPPP